MPIVSRTIKIRGVTSGVDEFEFPEPAHLQVHREILLTYLTNLEKIKVELNKILYKIAIERTVIVSTVNKGQSELLTNFVCSARSRGLDLSNMIIFPTDLHSKALAESMGLATFYSEEVNHYIFSSLLLLLAYRFGLLHRNLTNLSYYCDTAYEIYSFKRG